MYGIHIGDYSSVLAFQHCSIPSLYIFVVYDDAYYKMTAVTIADAAASSTPATPVDKNIQAQPGSIDVSDKTTVCNMWEGRGYDTATTPSEGKSYDVKDVKVTGCGLY